MALNFLQRICLLSAHSENVLNIKKIDGFYTISNIREIQVASLVDKFNRLFGRHLGVCLDIIHTRKL